MTRGRGRVSRSTREWFDAPEVDSGRGGLRFGCTMCGNCCTGPPGYVLITDSEARAIADRLGLSVGLFIERYTHETSLGRSLNEVPGEHGHDCVFLDRERLPGRAVCGIYEDRPAQCRTWPFWKQNLSSAHAWARAARRCPGMNTGDLIPPEKIRILRASTGD